mmetsp:Transcript_37824/g.88402  ORF Transcript_37824/g.88402 Transcript_37824/m.88402 type:complete len:84 (-) Transcript_37824:164-415(-)
MLWLTSSIVHESCKGALPLRSGCVNEVNLRMTSSAATCGEHISFVTIMRFYFGCCTALTLSFPWQDVQAFQRQKPVLTLCRPM